MSDIAKFFVTLCVAIMLVVSVVLGVNYFKNKDKGSTWIDKILDGSVAPEVEVVDTGFKVYSTNNGLAVVDPSSGVVTEDGTVLDYTNALYVDMTSETGYYQGSAFKIGKNFSGSFIYNTEENGKFIIYNQLFKDGNHTLGYATSKTMVSEFKNLETSDYLQNMTITKNGTTYNLTTKMNVFETNAMFYNLCAYAISKSSSGFGTYIVVLDVTDYFVAESNGEVIATPILFSYTVGYSNTTMAAELKGVDVTSKIFEMTTKVA